jgi:hypothetical protein
LPLSSLYITWFKTPVINNTEILDEISGTEIDDEYSSINRRINVYFDKEKIRYNLSIKKAVDRALFISDTTF